MENRKYRRNSLYDKLVIECSCDRKLHRKIHHKTKKRNRTSNESMSWTILAYILKVSLAACCFIRLTESQTSHILARTKPQERFISLDNRQPAFQARNQNSQASSISYNQRIRQLSSTLILPQFQQFQEARQSQPVQSARSIRPNRQQRQIDADRRDSIANQQQQPQQQQQPPLTSESNADDGKLLVCFYTTRQSLQNMPRDAHEFILPSDTLDKLQQTASSPTVADKQGKFSSTGLQLEPFVIANGRSGPAQSVNGFGVPYGSAQLAHKYIFGAQTPLKPLGLQASSRMQLNQFHTFDKTKSQLADETLGHMISMVEPFGVKQRNQLIFAGPNKASSFGLNHNLNSNHQNLYNNRQTPAYSLIGDFGDNFTAGSANYNGSNGLIVSDKLFEGASKSTEVASTTTTTTTATSGGSSIFGQTHGNNRNNLIINNNNNNNNNNNQNNAFRFERADSSFLLLRPQQPQLQQPQPQPQPQPQTQQQAQLVFSPSTLSRAFIVAASDNNQVSTGNENGHKSNFSDALEAKSQIFIPQLATTILASTAPSGGPIQQQSAATTSAPQVTPSNLHHLNQQQPSRLQTLPTYQLLEPFDVKQPDSQMPGQIFSSLVLNAAIDSPQSSNSVNQLIQATTNANNNRNPVQPTAQSVSFPSAGSVTRPQAQLIISNGSQRTFPSQSLEQNSNPKSSASLVSSVSKQSNSVNQGATHAPSGSTQATSPSSPLSTVFDVFGAASQYLMRFKPSTFMNQPTLSLGAHQSSSNAIDQSPVMQQSLSQQLHGPLNGLKGQLSSDNSSSPSTTASLLNSLSQFSSNLIAGSNKSSYTSSTNSNTNNSSSYSNASNGILSRFVSLSSQQRNQRREDVCGKTFQAPERRIIGGEGAKYGEFPYQVHIKIAKHQCGGALVDKQSIVTAAHCVYHFITRAPVSKLQIVIGAYDIEDEQYQELPPQYFKVNKVKLHPNFRFSASHPDRYDVAILKLDKPVKYTDNVLPVCLPGKDIKFENMIGTVTGFGKTDPSLSNRYGTRLLQKVDVPIIENNECERWHRTRGIDLKIFPEMMCAGYEDGLKDACVGDSGGPLVVKTAVGPNGAFRWTLAGITSAGFGCAQSRQPGIYHRVSHTVDWIIDNLD